MAMVLVVEDDTLTRHFLRQALEYGGHQVTTAGDGVEAIALLDKPGMFEAVITDYAMPRANGVDVIAHAQKIDPLVASIIITAFRDLDLAMQAMASGAVAFIPKPCKTDHLNTVLGKALERRALTIEAMRLRTLAPMLERFTMVLANTVETKDAATQQHANRLVHLSQLMAAHIGLSDEAAMAVRYGACLHDIGKIAVPEAVLRKVGPLEDEEQAMIRLHPEIGAAMLAGIDTWDDVRSIIRHHHERFDGTGYPDGLAGADIPIGARIVALADAVDVMQSGRPYAPARPHEQILDILKRERGSQFDPEMVDAFLAVTGENAAAHATGSGSHEPQLNAAGGGPGGAVISEWLLREAGVVRRTPAS